MIAAAVADVKMRLAHLVAVVLVVVSVVVGGTPSSAEESYMPSRMGHTSTFVPGVGIVVFGYVHGQLSSCQLLW